MFLRKKRISDETVDEREMSDEAVINEGKRETYSTYNETELKSKEASKMLMIYINEAIEKWAEEYNMQKLPKNVVFKMALTLMNSWDSTGIFK